jgi:hypothetical protein
MRMVLVIPSEGPQLSARLEIADHAAERESRHRQLVALMHSDFTDHARNREPPRLLTSAPGQFVSAPGQFRFPVQFEQPEIINLSHTHYGGRPLVETPLPPPPIRFRFDPVLSSLGSLSGRTVARRHRGDRWSLNLGRSRFQARWRSSGRFVHSVATMLRP